MAPNGLAAAELARNGRGVVVLEAEEIGDGTHSAIHPAGYAPPFFSAFGPA